MIIQKIKKYMKDHADELRDNEELFNLLDDIILSEQLTMESRYEALLMLILRANKPEEFYQDLSPQHILRSIASDYLHYVVNSGEIDRRSVNECEFERKKQSLMYSFEDDVIKDVNILDIAKEDFEKSEKAIWGE